MDGLLVYAYSVSQLDVGAWDNEKEEFPNTRMGSFTRPSSKNRKS